MTNHYINIKLVLSYFPRLGGHPNRGANANAPPCQGSPPALAKGQKNNPRKIKNVVSNNIGKRKEQHGGLKFFYSF